MYRIVIFFFGRNNALFEYINIHTTNIFFKKKEYIKLELPHSQYLCNTTTKLSLVLLAMYNLTRKLQIIRSMIGLIYIFEGYRFSE